MILISIILNIDHEWWYKDNENEHQTHQSLEGKETELFLITFIQLGDVQIKALSHMRSYVNF